MKYLPIKLPAALASAVLLVLALFSCSKDPYEIGIDLLPPTDTLNIRSTDTCTVEVFSVMQDSTRTDKLTTLVLGSYADPVFGKLTSSIYTQLRLESEGVDFGTQPALDSLVLMLFYDSSYGDTLRSLNLKVYEISEDFVYDSVYFSNKSLGVYPTLLADQDFVPRLHDSVSVFGVKQAPHLRINLSKLTKYFGNKILQAPSDQLETNAAFLKFIKGLYIKTTPASGNGSILNFSISNGISRMVVYYHNGADPADDSLQYSMVINSACARFAHVDHNNYLEAGSDLKQQIINLDSAKGARQVFLQGMAGVKVKVKFPFMKDFSGNKVIAINDAVLEMKNNETDTTFAPPSQILLLKQDSIGRIGYLADANEGTSYFGGVYHKSTASYSFRITRHIQTLVQGGYSNHFDLYMMVNDPIKSIITPNRVILNGTNPLDPSEQPNRLRLKLTYTVLN